MTLLAPLVTAFFRKHLAGDMGVSKHTITSYSYSFKFLCRYVSGRLEKSPSQLSLEDLDARMIRISWSISSETAAIHHGRETYA